MSGETRRITQYMGKLGREVGRGRNDSIRKSCVTMGNTKQPVPNQIFLFEKVHERGRENGIDYVLLVKTGLTAFLKKIDGNI